MSIDFCAAPFMERVELNKAHKDDRSASNLVSLDDAERNAGLILEGFVNVPVEVGFTLKYPIQVAAVRIYPRIVSHRTTGVELWFESYRGNFFCASRARNNQAETFHFFNMDYNPRISVQAQYGMGPVQRRQPGTGNGDGFEDSHTFRYRFGVKRIVIKLVACESPRAPGLGHLEIWGQPANVCDDEAVGAIVNGIWRQRQGRSHPPPSPRLALISTDANLSSHFQSPDSSSTAHRQDPLKIESTRDLQDAFPDFFDPISCEVMTYPMLLPSGYTVDKATLEKYCEVERFHGRLPNDPFTRIPFEHPACIPVPHTALKDRIDDVIRRHHACGTLTELGRCVGDGVANGEAAPRSPFAIKTSNLVSTSSSPPSTDINPAFPSRWTAAFEASGPSSKRPKLDLSVDRSHNHRLHEPLPGPSNKRPRLETATTSDTYSSHAEELRRSLDDSIANILCNSAVSSPTALERNPQATYPPLCGRCGSFFNLYKLPCEHLLCRNCLTHSCASDRDVIVCQVLVCRMQARRANVIKVHT